MEKTPPRPSTDRNNIVGRSLELAQLHIVALYDPESGVVLHRHSIAVLKGAEEVKEEAAIKAAFGKAKAFHERVQKDAEQMKKYAAVGQALFPLHKLKAAVSNDLTHLEMDLRVDPKSGRIVELSEKEEQPGRMTRPRSLPKDRS